jgi:hypothetical protein
MLLEVMLHAADISNPIKPWAVYEKWADLVMEEFFLQVFQNLLTSQHRREITFTACLAG